MIFIAAEARMLRGVYYSLIFLSFTCGVELANLQHKRAYRKQAKH
jgi:hypothetical protein